MRPGPSRESFRPPFGDRLPDSIRDLASIARGVHRDDRTTLGVSALPGRIGVGGERRANASVKGVSTRLDPVEPVATGAPSAGAGTREPDVGRELEQNREVWYETVGREAVRRADG